MSKEPTTTNLNLLGAVELKLRITVPNQIELVIGDPASAEYAKKIRALLN